MLNLKAALYFFTVIHPHYNYFLYLRPVPNETPSQGMKIRTSLPLPHLILINIIIYICVCVALIYPH